MNKEEYIDSILLENDRLYKENNQLKENLKLEKQISNGIAKDYEILLNQKKELKSWLKEDNDKINVLDAKDNSLVKLGIMIGLGMCLDKLNELEGDKNES